MSGILTARKSARPTPAARGAHLTAALPTLLSLLAAANAGAAPAFHRAIRVRPAQVSGGPLTNYPFLFNTTDAALRHTSSGGSVRSLNGWDIIFATTPVCADSTTCGGNKLDHEVERYTPATGELVAWVRLPSIDNGTAFYIHYGDPAVTASTENRTGLWGTTYEAVWHLSEAPANGTNGGHVDSRHNTTAGALFNNGTPQGFTAAPSSTSATGIAAGADRFYRPVAGTDVTNDDTINVTDHATLEPAGDMTLETWVNASTLPAPGSGNFHLLAQKNYLTASPWNSYQLFFRGDAGATQLWFGWTNTVPTAYYAVNAGPFSTGTWYHVAGVLSGNTVTLYVNGSAAGTTTATKAGTLLGTADLLSIGNGQAPSNGTDGILDEARLSNTARSAGWLLTQYRNVSSPPTFYELDADVMQVRSGSYVGNGATRSITGLGFAPDYVMITSAETWGRNTVVRTSTMTGNVSHSIYYYPYHPLVDRITSLDGDGFSVGHPPDHAPNNDVNRGTPAAANPYHCVNHSGVTYYWTAFKAAAGEMKASFYTGNGAATQNVTGVGFQPDYVIVFPDSGAHPLLRTSTMSGDLSFVFDGGTGKTQQIIALQADGFQVGQGSLTNFNTNGARYHYLAWRNTPGRVRVGSYGGTGAANRQITGVGFRPELVTITPSDTASPTTVGAWGSSMKPGATGSASDYALEYMLYGSQGNINMIHALEPDGFRVARTTNYLEPVNQSGKTYHWVAFGPLTAAPVTNYRSIGTAANYTTGTVTVAAGSTLVTGGGATPPDWVAANRGRGDKITFDGGTTWYTVLGVTSATSLTLTAPFPGTGCAAGGCAYTISRKFATLVAWEDCIDGPTSSATCEGIGSASLVADNRKEVGIAYKETPLARVTIAGSATDALRTITLTADPGNRHLGLRGNGVVVNGSSVATVLVEDEFVTVEWLELQGGADEGVEFQTITPVSNKGVVRNMLIHDVTLEGILIDDAGANVDVYNNIVHDSSDPGNGTGIRVGTTLTTGTVRVFNNTVYSNAAGGITASGSNPGMTLRNNIALGNTGSGDYNVAARNAASSNNLAGNASGTTHSPAGGGINNVTATADPSNCPTICVGFSSITAGSENLHLISTTYPNQAVNAGADLSASFGRDIDNQLRPTGAGTWDIGADERDGFTAVKLAFFAARGFESSVLVEWETASELDNLGFHLYRAPSADGPWARLNASLIPGLGSSPEGKSYRYVDSGLVNGTTYFYRLEDVDRRGRVTSHGPVSATPVAGLAEPGEGEGPTEPAPPPRETPRPPERKTHADPTEQSLRVLERSELGVTLELVTGGFYSEEQADGTAKLLVPGFFDHAEPGFPTVPTRRLWVDAVVGRGASLVSVAPSEVVSFPGLSVSLAGQPVAVTTREGTYEARSIPVKREGRGGAAEGGSVASRAGGLFPASAALVHQTAFQGERKKAYVELAPLRVDEASGEVTLARRLVVRLAFTGEVEGESGRGSLGRSRPLASGAPDAQVLARLATRSRGLHAVAFEEVPGLFAPLAPSDLRLSRLGAPVAFHLEPHRRPFGPGSALFFLAEDPDSAYANEAVYELSTGPGGVQMPGPPLTRRVSSSAPLPLLRTERSFEKDAVYLPALLEARDLWVWDNGLPGGQGASYPFTLDSPVLAPETARLSLDLQGGSDTEADPDHHVLAFLNGSLVGETRFDGMVPHTLALELPTSLLLEGDNTLRLENAGDTGSSASFVYLDRFSLELPVGLAPVGGVLEGRAAQNGRATLAAAPGSLAFDVTGPTPRFLARASADSRLAWNAEAGHRYLAVSPEAFGKPEVRPAPSTTLRSPQNQADWIVVAPEALLPAAQPLVSLRQSQGLAALAVSLEAVNDEFGHGEAGPHAVRNFLASAFHTWQAPSPRYVLLLGDASYDPKGHLTGTSRPDLIPSPLTKSTFLWTPADPLYAAVNGSDSLPDIAIGRINAATPAEAEAAVRKILDFETSGLALDGKATLVADNPDLAGDFEANQDEIATLLPSRSVEKLYLARLGAAGTKAAVKDAFDTGLSLMSYVGHGSSGLWATEGILRSPDIASFAPQPRQPLVLTMTCSNGYFLSPYNNSLAERLVLAEGKGAIAAFAPSGLSLNDAAHVYHQAVVAELELGGHDRLGDLLLAAQAHYAASGAFPELLQIYNLLGDPGTRIR